MQWYIWLRFLESLVLLQEWHRSKALNYSAALCSWECVWWLIAENGRKVRCKRKEGKCGRQLALKIDQETSEMPFGSKYYCMLICALLCVCVSVCLSIYPSLSWLWIDGGGFSSNILQRSALKRSACREQIQPWSPHGILRCKKVSFFF